MNWGMIVGVLAPSAIAGIVAKQIVGEYRQWPLIESAAWMEGPEGGLVIEMRIFNRREESLAVGGYRVTLPEAGPKSSTPRRIWRPPFDASGLRPIKGRIPPRRSTEAEWPHLLIKDRIETPFLVTGFLIVDVRLEWTRFGRPQNRMTFKVPIAPGG